MKQKPVKKLNLGKKTIARLSEPEVNAAIGGSISTISIVYTRGCMTDITRPSTTYQTSGGPSYSG